MLRIVFSPGLRYGAILIPHHSTGHNAIASYRQQLYLLTFCVILHKLVALTHQSTHYKCTGSSLVTPSRYTRQAMHVTLRWFCGTSLAGVVGSNPRRRHGIYLFSCQIEVCATS